MTKEIRIISLDSRKVILCSLPIRVDSAQKIPAHDTIIHQRDTIQLARLEVDVVENLSVVVSVQDAKPAVKAFCYTAFRFRLVLPRENPSLLKPDIWQT